MARANGVVFGLLSLSTIISKRATLLVLIAVVFISVAPLLTRFGKEAYALFFAGGILILFVLIVRQSYKDFPSSAAATSERSFSTSSSLVSVCAAIPQAVKSCNWNLVRADKVEGHFTAKIGMSRKTWYQIMEITVRKMNGDETTIDVRCEAPHILWDRGQNDRMIDKFHETLKKRLNAKGSV